jgi:hypothetical protein
VRNGHLAEAASSGFIENSSGASILSGATQERVTSEGRELCKSHVRSEAQYENATISALVSANGTPYSGGCLTTLTLGRRSTHNKGASQGGRSLETGRGVARKKKVPLPDGTFVEGTVMPFQTGGEHWNEYLVDDGTVLRVKQVATEVIRVDGYYDQEGNPMYLLNSTNVMVASSPDDLKRKEE